MTMSMNCSTAFFSSPRFSDQIVSYVGSPASMSE
jgi:hypothetical protein